MTDRSVRHEHGTGELRGSCSTLSLALGVAHSAKA
jgi:hypothetical protein